MNIVAVYNVKGGVGKTAISVNLAHLSASTGHRTLLWDLDEQGGASTTLGIQAERGSKRVRRTYEIKDHLVGCEWEGIDLIPASGLVHLLDRHDRPSHLRELLAKLENSYDYVILDCPPTLGMATDQIISLADLIVVPIVPSPLSHLGFQQLQAYAASQESSDSQFMPVHSMVDRRRRAHQDAIASEPDWPVIPYAAAVEQATASRQPVAKFAPRSPAAQSLADLWKRVENHLK